MERDVLDAFQTGDPAIAYTAAMQMVAEYGELLTECARLRFEVNFGSPVCQRCDGLKAGPGVVATCYQLRRCEFRNVREGDMTPKQLRCLDLFEMDPKSS